MRILNKLLGRREIDSELSPEVTNVFEKIERFMTDDQVQNASLPTQLRQLIESGPAVDEIPRSKGEFGRVFTNPIPVNGPIGEITYLSKLVTPSGAGLFGHRLGHVHNVDVYETVSTDGGAWDILFISFYHPRKSRKVPTGYRLAKPGERAPFITCTNFRVDGFPLPMEAAIRECMRRILGFPLRPPDLTRLLTSQPFVRTPEQNSRLADLAEIGFEPAASYTDAGG